MTKHLLATTAAICLCVAAPALANDSTISQIGGTNTAAIDQTGGNEGVSSVSQIGTGLVATVTQADDPNTGIPGFNTPSNLSTITQEGSGATATVNQTGDPGESPGNESVITQFSDGAAPTLADVLQDGANNFSSVEQGRDADPLDRSGQTAIVMQIGEDHVSTILQRGNLNTATVTQENEGNTSDITQTGADNDAGVMQTGVGNLSTITQNANFGLATVDQSGNDNVSEITQSGSVNSSVAGLVDQSGNDNLSTITQSSSVPARNQFAQVTQSTHNNTSLITQSGDAGPPPSDPALGNDAFVYQTATSGNFSTIMQSGAGNLATVNQ